MNTYCEFGNLEQLIPIQKDEKITFFWRRMLTQSKSIYFGDVTLYVNGVKNRFVINFDKKITDKSTHNICKTIKY